MGAHVVVGVHVVVGREVEGAQVEGTHDVGGQEVVGVHVVVGAVVEGGHLLDDLHLDLRELEREQTLGDDDGWVVGVFRDEQTL